MANESINLNLIPTGEMPVIHVSQFDNGRAFNVNLFKGSDEYTIPVGYTAELHCRKADRNIVTLATTSVLSNALTFTTTTQLCACAGKNLCEVVIKDAEDYQVGTLNFILEVEKDPLQGGIDSTSDIHDLEDQIEDITTEIISENYYTKTETDTLLDAKANAADVYTKSQVDTALSAKANAADVYTKTEVDTALSAKANAADVYTKSQVDTALSAKANAADVYTKSQVDTALSAKANAADVYTKTQTDSLLSAKANSADLATVATTGSYTDLTNKPDIPAAQVQSDYAQSDNTKVDYIKNKPDLSVYALNNNVYDKSFITSLTQYVLGEGYDSVDLGSLTWYGPVSNDRYYSNGISNEAEPSTIYQTDLIFAMDLLTAISDGECAVTTENNVIAIGGDSYIYARKTECADAAAFKAAMNGIILFYKKKIS